VANDVTVSGPTILTEPPNILGPVTFNVVTLILLKVTGPTTVKDVTVI